MKGKQVNVYLTPSDQSDLVRRITERTNFAIIRDIAETALPEIITTADIQEMGKDRLKIYMCALDDPARILFQYVPVQNHWSVDQIRSPVVEFSRCYYTPGEILRRGRFYFIDKYYDGDTLRKKAGSFVDFGNLVLRVARKFLVKGDLLEYYGREAKSLKEAGKIRFSAG